MPSTPVKRQRGEEEDKEGEKGMMRTIPPPPPPPPQPPGTLLSPTLVTANALEQLSIEEGWDMLSSSSSSSGDTQTSSSLDEDEADSPGDQERHAYITSQHHQQPYLFSPSPPTFAQAQRPRPDLQPCVPWLSEDWDTLTRDGTASESGASEQSAVSSNTFDPIFFPDRCVTPTAANCSGRPQRTASIRHGILCQLCSEEVRGVRWMCKDCPSWNVCESCFEVSAENEVHPIHTFIRLTSPADIFKVRSEVPRDWNWDRTWGGEMEYTLSAPVVHLDVQCHNCHGSIIGARYDCAAISCKSRSISFCQDCEALPINCHPPTHPLIKYKLPKEKCTEKITTEWWEKELSEDAEESREEGGNAMGKTASQSTNEIPSVTPFPPPLKAPTPVLGWPDDSESKSGG